MKCLVSIYPSQASGFTFCVYNRRPVVRSVDDIIKWFTDLLAPNILVVADFNLPDIDWHTLSLKQTNDVQMHSSFLDAIRANSLKQIVFFPDMTRVIT